MRRILVTSALPYANGPLHFGHILEAVQTDIWARAMRLSGHECIYVCADDTHGTPMMLKAQAEGITPEQLIAGVEAEHRATYGDFLIDHAQFHSTHSDENREMTSRLFLALEKAGYIATRSIRQAYDATAQMFLPDRYVKGTCPRCGTKDQYGDSCESCGATYSPSELIDAVSVVTGTPPVERESEHLFFRLDQFEAMLREWTRSGALHESVANKLDEWFNAGLRDWDISRDAPYFGFEIPGHAGKYFYVWLDAPIGYMGASLAYARRTGADFDAWWSKDSTAELHHFIGKDILYFHTLFWPAVLTGAGFRRPTQVHAHGFLTVNGAKMSKSRGTFITGRRYLERLPPEALRYYFAAKLGPGIDDMDLSLEDFVNRFNSDVVGKLVNIASRCAGFIARGGGALAAALPQPALYAEFAALRTRIAGLYEARDFSTAIREIAALADRANQYIDAEKPWNLAKDPARAADVAAVCTQGINLFRVLITYLQPVLPSMAEAAGRFLGSPIRHWEDVAQPMLGTALATYEPLATRLDPKIVATLIEPDGATPPAPAPAATSAKPAPVAKSAPSAQVAPTPVPTADASGEITIEDFAKVDLRVARVLAADFIEGSDKLLKLSVDLGTEQRTIFAGIRGAYEPAQLVGRHVVVVANLKPRKMRFGVSQGMVLAASGDGPGVFLVAPEEGGAAGMRVK
jgi:methionyl-tRNA synthetase